MAISRWSLVRFVHVPAAMGWVGGSAPPERGRPAVLRGTIEPDVRDRLVHRTAERFAAIANAVLLPSLLIIGVLLVSIAASRCALATRSRRHSRSPALPGLASSGGIVVFATALSP